MVKYKLPARYVEELVGELAGSDAVSLVKLMLDKDYISEFKLAEKLKISVNQIRNMLYRLQNHNLVDFIRKKDKKKGWYIYYWLFDLNLAKKLIKEIKENKIVYLRKRLEHEKEEVYYKCPNDCIRLNAINAMEHNFRCDECGEILTAEDIKKSSELIKKEVKQLEEDLQELGKEFIIKAKEEKLKEAKLKIKSRKPKKKKGKIKRVKRRILKKKAKKKVKKKLARKAKSKKKSSSKTRLNKLKRILKKIKKSRR